MSLFAADEWLGVPAAALEPKVYVAFETEDRAGEGMSTGAGVAEGAVERRRSAMAPLLGVGGLVPLRAPTTGPAAMAAAAQAERVPRRVEVERRQRANMAAHEALPALLRAAGVPVDLHRATGARGPASAALRALLSAGAAPSCTLPQASQALLAPHETLLALPLGTFDDEEREGRAPAEWLALGVARGLQCGVPAQALDAAAGAWRACRAVCLGAGGGFLIAWTRAHEGAVAVAGSGLGAGAGTCAGGSASAGWDAGAGESAGGDGGASSVAGAIASEGLGEGRDAVQKVGALGGAAPPPASLARLATLGCHGWAAAPRLSLCFVAEPPGPFATRVGAAWAAREAAAERLAALALLQCIDASRRSEGGGGSGGGGSGSGDDTAGAAEGSAEGSDACKGECAPPLREGLTTAGAGGGENSASTAPAEAPCAPAALTEADVARACEAWRLHASPLAEPGLREGAGPGAQEAAPWQWLRGAALHASAPPAAAPPPRPPLVIAADAGNPSEGEGAGGGSAPPWVAAAATLPPCASIERPPYNFQGARGALRFALLTTSPHAVAALACVAAQCLRLAEGAGARGGCVWEGGARAVREGRARVHCARILHCAAAHTAQGCALA